jgi:hypothetical protein
MIDLHTLYWRSGFVTGAFLEPGDLTTMLSDCDRLQEQAAGLSRTAGDFNLEAVEGGFHSQQNGEGRALPGILRKVSNVVAHSPAAAQIAARDTLKGLTATLIGTESVDLVHSILWFKPARLGSAKPPHQDAAYLSGDPDQYATVWIALDDCDPENGCLRVVPTSHRHAYSHTGTEPQIDPSVWTMLSWMDVPLHPGWGIAFHPRLLHASSANTSDRPRRALMLRYQGR